MILPDSLIPDNDRKRLQALAPYLMLGTAPDAVFDEVVRLTAKLFSVPIALVSLVEEGSVWFKTNFGLMGAERVRRNESVTLYDHLDQSLNRLDTLAGLASWETSPNTPQARRYQVSFSEEADLVTRLLDQQTTTALAALSQPHR